MRSIWLLAAAACASAHTAHHWSYQGEGGPSHWGALNPESAACASGSAQSPIDIAVAQQQDLPNLVFHYAPSRLNVVNNGHTIQVDYDPGSFIELDGGRYELAQFHVHAPSEHSIDGKLAKAEIHLVHRSAEAKLAVVALLVNAGAENGALAPVWAHLPASPGPAQHFDGPVSVSELLPNSLRTWRYDGSLTTPPCSEGVKWNVMVAPIEMSESQLAAFRAIVDGNNRPVQPLNGRRVVEDSSP